MTASPSFCRFFRLFFFVPEPLFSPPLIDITSLYPSLQGYDWTFPSFCSTIFFFFSLGLPFCTVRYHVRFSYAPPPFPFFPLQFSFASGKKEVSDPCPAHFSLSSSPADTPAPPSFICAGFHDPPPFPAGRLPPPHFFDRQELFSFSSIRRPCSRSARSPQAAELFLSC